MDGKPLLTVIHRLRPVREIEPHYWKLRWRLIRHMGRSKRYGTWNVYWTRAWRSHPLGIVLRFDLPQDGTQYGRRNNCVSLRIGLWWGSAEIWLKWGFKAMDREHGDGVDGIDLAAWGIVREPPGGKEIKS